ncbi:P-II family nitrogen regulator [Pseudidiomarina gelatinasegens]|uniref:P-II family nitrogen regulator n=1 Tax=Pseudidiomarina gelatinasegens TaxID=2487740 RepID=UPI003A96C65A|tara:strand:- start:2247 stop:2585 length:339 start_codon:yes stop_codon:yes gene_type:complete
MNLSKITAIFDQLRQDSVEEALIGRGVSGFTLFPVRGRGYYFDSYNDDHLVDHVQLEVYVNSDDARDVALLVVEAAHTGVSNEGLVSISPIDELFWVHDKRVATNKELSLQS